jgi:hypothetical protein
MKKIHATLLVLFLIHLINAQYAHAQRDFTSDPIKIVKPYQPKLLEALKIATNPQAAPIKPNNDKQKLNYAAVTRSINTDFKPEPIQALKPKTENPDPLHNFFVRAGFGNYITPLLDVHYQTGRKSKYEIAADLHHLSSKGSLNTNAQTGQMYKNMAFSDNKAGLNIKRIFETISVGAGAKYERNSRRFYGYNPADTTFNNEQSTQNINRLHTFIKIEGTPKQKGIPSYKITPSYTLTTNKYQETEHNFNVAGSIFAAFENSHISIPITYDYRQYKPNTGFVTTKKNTGLFTLNPRFGMQKERFAFEIGINTAHQQLKTNSLAITDSSSFHIFPFAKIGFDIIQDKALTAFVGIDGGFEQNTFDNITRRNPFVQNNLDIKNTLNKTHIFAGINGQIVENLSYKAQVGIKECKNMLFYVNDTTDFRRIAPVYAQTGKITEFSIETQYKPNQSLDLNLITTYKTFNLDSTLRQPYMQPNLSTHFNLRYNYDQTWYFGADIFGYSGIKYLSKTGTTNTLKSAIDLNLMAEYRLKNNLTFFANFNNLAASHYFRYYNYPTFGISALGGLTYKF